jgi:hypothetical protein
MCVPSMSVYSILMVSIVDGVLIATRYLNRLTKEKKVEHNHKLGLYHAVSGPDPPTHSRDASGMSDDLEMLHPRNSTAASIVSYGGAYDYGDDVIDITHQPTSYEPVPTHNPDMLTHSRQPSQLSNTPTHSPKLSQSSSTPTHRQQLSQSNAYRPSSASSRGFRALPPRPSSSTVTESSSIRQLPQARKQIPQSTHSPGPSLDFSTQSNVDHDQRSTHTEVSTSAHSALMDHASFMWSRFFPPPGAPPVPELPPPYHLSQR